MKPERSPHTWFHARLQELASIPQRWSKGKVPVFARATEDGAEDSSVYPGSKCSVGKRPLIQKPNSGSRLNLWVKTTGKRATHSSLHSLFTAQLRMAWRSSGKVVQLSLVTCACALAPQCPLGHCSLLEQFDWAKYQNPLEEN